MRIYLFPAMFILAAGITGCKVSGSETVTTHITSYVGEGSMAIHAPGRPDADITTAGDLSIAGTKVAVTPEQRELIQKYYVLTLMMRDPDVAAGNRVIAAHAEQVCTTLADLRSTQEKRLARQLPTFQP